MFYIISNMPFTLLKSQDMFISLLSHRLQNCRGVGDNYGRHAALNTFTDDARSVHSLADEFLLPVGSAGSRHHAKTISRSTDKSLDAVGLQVKYDLSE